MNAMKRVAFAASVALTTIVTAHAAEPPTNSWPASRVGEATPTVQGMPSALARNLATFDDLDFRVYTKQQWDDLHLSHAKDIVVHYPDGHTTTGLPDHIKELDFMWTFAPDNRITEHPVRFGSANAEWTAVAGFIEGTFSKPMVLADGTVIQPTNKTYRLPMVTIGHWNEEGQMTEEFLYWNNAAFMKQIGVGN
jgi:hypothetical protein